MEYINLMRGHGNNEWVWFNDYTTPIYYFMRGPRILLAPSRPRNQLSLIRILKQQAKLANKNKFVKVLAANTHGISSQTYGATVEDA